VRQSRDLTKVKQFAAEAPQNTAQASELCLYARKCSKVRHSRDLTQLKQFAADAAYHSKDDRTLFVR
jgi:hypothetical protein